jgi:hypothetical protein
MISEGPSAFIPNRGGNTRSGSAAATEQRIPLQDREDHIADLLSHGLALSLQIVFRAGGLMARPDPAIHPLGLIEHSSGISDLGRTQRLLAEPRSATL